MSKQSEAKERQGYTKPSQRACGTCKHFRFDMEWPAWILDGKHDSYMREDRKVASNLRCGLGGFAVKKLSMCNEWAPEE